MFQRRSLSSRYTSEELTTQRRHKDCARLAARKARPPQEEAEARGPDGWHAVAQSGHRFLGSDFFGK